MQKRLPNIILIFCDDLGYGDIGCYGSHVNKTPVLDSLAKRGMKFTDFYVSASVCSPSRASLMTGCYPQRIGLAAGSRATVLRPADPIGLGPNEITIADLLKKQGYTTGLIGKWHIGDQPPFLPTKHGFDEYFGLPFSNDMGPDHWQEDFPPIPLMKGENAIEFGPDQTTLTHRYTEECISFIKKHKDNPFFLYFSHMYVHLPLFAPQEFLKKSQNGVYGAAVEIIDWSTGKILETLKELELADNTLVIFTSDNGSNCKDGGSNAPLRGTKGTTWEGGLREPCIMYWPGVIPSGHTCSEISTTMDLTPTLAHLAGIDVPSDRIIDGKDIWPLMIGSKGASTPYDAFFYYKGYDLQAVRMGKWKLHIKEKQLYNLRDDIGEKNNLLDNNPSVAEKLQYYKEKCREDLGDGKVKGRNIRKAGRVDNPIFINNREELIQAEYD